MFTGRGEIAPRREVLGSDVISESASQAVRFLKVASSFFDSMCLQYELSEEQHQMMDAMCQQASHTYESVESDCVPMDHEITRCELCNGESYNLPCKRGSNSTLR